MDVVIKAKRKVTQVVFIFSSFSVIIFIVPVTKVLKQNSCQNTLMYFVCLFVCM